MESHINNSNKNNFNILILGEYLFYIGIFLLSSLVPIGVLFLILSILIVIFKFGSHFFVERYNFIFFLISIFLISSTLYTHIFSESFNLEKYESTTNWLSLVNWIPFFIAFRAFQFYLKTSTKREKFIKVLIAGSFPVFISIIAQYHFNIFGPFSIFNGLIIWFQKPLVLDNANAKTGVAGLFSNPNYTAYWLSTILPLTIYLFTSRCKKILRKIFTFLLLSAVIYFLILTDSRNGFLSIFVSFYFMFGLKIFVIIGLILFFIFTIYFLLKSFLPMEILAITEKLFERSLFIKITNINFKNISVFTRIDLFYKTINFILEKPIFGWLAGSFSAIYLLRGGSFSIQHTHNLFLQVAFDYGIIPALLLFSTIFYLLINSYIKIFHKENNSTLNKAWFTMTLVSVIFHFFDIPYFDVRISILFWVYLAGLKSYLDEKNKLIKF